MRGVSFHGESNLSNSKRALPAGMLGELAHPWLVIEDAHVNTAQVVRRLFRYMTAGDYLIVEDIRFGAKKRREW